MKMRELLDIGKDRLKESKVPDYIVDADILWQYVSGMDRVNMLLTRDEEVPEEQEDVYLKLIDTRCTRVPLQYITGTQNFCGFEFDVARNVLIPRQDTETLVETALGLIEKTCNNSAVDGERILDMCCGSGCIGISIGLFRENAKVILADISDDALGLAKRNVEKLCGSNKRFAVCKSDMFSSVSGKFDIIVSNPPYIRSDVIETLMPEVRDHEPRLALDGYADGLYFYRIIIDNARKYIKDGCYVVFEIGNDQAEDVQHLFVDSGYDDVRIVKDLCHNDRVVYGRYAG